MRTCDGMCGMWICNAISGIRNMAIGKVRGRLESASGRWNQSCCRLAISIDLVNSLHALQVGGS